MYDRFRVVDIFYMTGTIGEFVEPTSVLEYSFEVVNWTIVEIRKTDRKFKKLLNTYGMFHPCADIDRINVTRKKKGDV